MALPMLCLRSAPWRLGSFSSSSSRSLSYRRQKREFFEYQRAPEVISSDFLALLLSRRDRGVAVPLTLNMPIVAPLVHRRAINETLMLKAAAARVEASLELSKQKNQPALKEDAAASASPAAVCEKNTAEDEPQSPC